jgi:hypothetical protein
MVAKGNGVTVTTPTLLSVLLHNGVAPDVIVIFVRVTLNAPVEAVEAAFVGNGTDTLPTPVIVLPVTVPSV